MGPGCEIQCNTCGQLKGKPTEGNGSPIPMLLPCSAGGDPNLIQSLPWGQAQLRGGGGAGEMGCRTVVPDSRHRCGIRAPPGGVCQKCQAQARGPLDLRQSPAALYQYQDPGGDEQA